MTIYYSIDDGRTEGMDMYTARFSNGRIRTELALVSACCFAKDDLRQLGLGSCEVTREEGSVVVARYEWKSGKLTAWVR